MMKIKTYPFLITFTCLPFFSLSAQAVKKINSPQSICDKVIKKGNYEHALKICRDQLDNTLEKEMLDNATSSNSLFLYLHLVDIYHALGKSQLESDYLRKIKQHALFEQEPEAAYQWHRRMGQRYYFAKDYKKAGHHLYQGLELAKHDGKNNFELLAKSYNDVGLVESQLGNFREALRHYQQSLKIKLKLGDKYRVGTTLNNIGLIYAKLENTKQSVEYYEKALDAFLAYTEQDNFDRRVFNNINHVYEDLAVIYNQLESNQRDDNKQQSVYKQKAADSIKTKNSKWAQARALINIARLQLEDKRPNSAKQFLEKASQLQSNHPFDLRLELNLQWARYFLQAEDYAGAISYANSGVLIAEQKSDLLSLEKLYQVLSLAYLSSDAKTAYHYLEKHAQTREQFLAQKYNSELQSVQLEIDKQQVEHQLMQEKIENSENRAQIQRLTNWTLSVVILLLVFSGFIIFFWFKKRKEKQSLLQSIKYHQQQLLLLDDKYQNLSQSHFDKQSIDSEDKEQSEHKQSEDNLSVDNQIKISDAAETQSEQENNSIQTNASSPSNSPSSHPGEEQVGDKEKSSQQLKQKLREVLVETMLTAVSIWESYTKSNRVELAEKSKIWTVSVDNGTLRTRSLDKYINLEKIPLNPRWRNVAGTCHFILADPELPPADREKLTQSLDSVMLVVKELSMSGSN